MLFNCLEINYILAEGFLKIKSPGNKHQDINLLLLIVYVTLKQIRASGVRVNLTFVHVLYDLCLTYSIFSKKIHQYKFRMFSSSELNKLKANECKCLVLISLNIVI